MTTTYGSTPTKRKWTKRQIAIVAAAGAVLIGPTAAYAAVKIFGFGEGAVNGATVANLTIDTVQLTGPLYPGSTVDGKAIVRNPNKFPVKVNSSIIRAEGLTATGGGNCDTTGILTPGGVYNANQGPDVGPGWKINLPEPVTIPAEGAVWVTTPNAVTLSSQATAMCGFSGKFAVEGTVGN